MHRGRRSGRLLLPAERAKRGLAIYFGAVLFGSGAFEALLIRTGDPIGSHPALVVANMWVPCFAALAARLVMREGIRDVSFQLRRRSGLPMLAIGWLLPVCVGLLAYGAAWAFNLEPFGRRGDTRIAPFFASLASSLTLYTGLSAITALGEELGWRGFMLTRLIQAGFKRPILISGLVWSLWHLPMIVTGQYASGPYPIVSAVVFTVATTLQSYVYARLRLESGSVWPAVLLHSSWNAVIQITFDGFTQAASAGHTQSIWIGESGIFVLIVDLVVVLALTRKPFPVRFAPDDEPVRTLALRES